MDPILHYIYYGFKEGRNPNSHFDIDNYLKINIDTNSDINPLVHYGLFGINERKKTFESSEIPIKKSIQEKSVSLKETTKRFQIIQFTPEKTKNPYYTMIGDELISRDIDFKYINNFQKIEEILKKKISFSSFTPTRTLLSCEK